MPAAPRLGFTFVDVRDVADLHIRALTTPAAGGERFIATDTWMWMPDVAAVLRERLGEAAKKVPTRVAPDLLIRAMALFDGGIRSVVGDLGKRTWFSSDKARTTLGWTTRPVNDSIEETARSLLYRRRSAQSSSDSASSVATSATRRSTPSLWTPSSSITAQ